MAVDSLGLVCALSVLTADAHDRDGGRWLLAAARGWSPRVREVTAGRGFGRRFIEFVRAVCGRRVTAAAGFEVPPRRWVAGRAFARLVSYRRRRVGHESLPETSEAMIQVAMIHPMIRRLEPGRQFQDTLIEPISQPR